MAFGGNRWCHNGKCSHVWIVDFVIDWGTVNRCEHDDMKWSGQTEMW